MLVASAMPTAAEWQRFYEAEVAEYEFNPQWNRWGVVPRKQPLARSEAYPWGCSLCFRDIMCSSSLQDMLQHLGEGGAPEPAD